MSRGSRQARQLAPIGTGLNAAVVIGIVRPFRPRRWSVPAVAAIWLAQCFIATSPMAIDILPLDYYPLPSGTNYTGLYYLYSQSDMLNMAGGGTIKDDTGLHTNLGVLRHTYYGDVDGRSWAVELIVPYGTTGGELAGTELRRATGFGDVLLAAGISFLPHPEPIPVARNIALVLYASLPTGNYSPGRTLNLGSNQSSFDTQLGYTQGFGHLWVDAAADLILYTGNGNAGPNHGTLHEQPTYQGQVWLSFTPIENVPTSLVSVGYAAQFGGAESINQTSIGVKTESQQVRLAYSRYMGQFGFVTQVSRDVHVVGGFKQSFGLTLRATYRFGGAE